MARFASILLHASAAVVTLGHPYMGTAIVRGVPDGGRLGGLVLKQVAPAGTPTTVRLCSVRASEQE